MIALAFLLFTAAAGCLRAAMVADEVSDQVLLVLLTLILAGGGIGLFQMRGVTR